MDHKGKVAVITGASRGIGKQMALKLAKYGVDLVLAARTITAQDSELPGSLSQTEAEVRALGVQTLVVRCDVTFPEQVRALYARALEHFGRIDYLINNALHQGPDFGAAFLDIDLAGWMKNINANLVAPVVAAQTALPAMIKAGRGLILFMSSGAATHDGELLAGQGGVSSAYCTTKAALNRLTQTLSRETRAYGIPVIALNPGGTITERVEYDEEYHPGKTIQVPRHSIKIPAAAFEYLTCTCPEPMRYSGRIVEAAALVKELGLL